MFEPIGSPPTCVEVVVTAGDADWLGGFVRGLVEDGLAASAQTVAAVRTLSRRAGTIHEEVQARVALHTRAVYVDAIVDRVERDHPDGALGVFALRMIDGSTEYLQWIVHETADAQQPVGRRR